MFFLVLSFGLFEVFLNDLLNKLLGDVINAHLFCYIFTFLFILVNNLSRILFIWIFAKHLCHFRMGFVRHFYCGFSVDFFLILWVIFIIIWIHIRLKPVIMMVFITLVIFCFKMAFFCSLIVLRIGLKLYLIFLMLLLYNRLLIDILLLSLYNSFIQKMWFFLPKLLLIIFCLNLTLPCCFFVLVNRFCFFVIFHYKLIIFIFILIYIG